MQAGMTRLHRELHHRLPKDPFHVRYSPRPRAAAAGQYSILTYFLQPIASIPRSEDDGGPVT